MREKRMMNEGWKFHYGEIGVPAKTVRKAAAIGGFTSVILPEEGEVVPLGAGGHHFLRLISGGDEKKGLMMLAGTKFDVNSDSWEAVTLPHDWKSQLPFSPDMSLYMSGSKPDGIGYYRKTFSLEENLKGKEISLYFEGVCRSASIWFNGCFLGDHYSGYTSFPLEITELARYGSEGQNVLLVRVDTETGSEGWWYEGGGIYRNVYLQITEKIHVKQWGIHCYTEKVESNGASICVESDVVNHRFQNEDMEIITTIYFGETKVASNKVDLHLKSMESKQIENHFLIENPNLWSLEDPNLYTAVVEIEVDNQVIDRYSDRFGIRTLRYTTEGLFLNGVWTEIKGVCGHQDFAGVGTAVTKNILKYKLRQLKKMGVNAYRNAHHCASEDLLTLCDEMGIMVMEENRVLESSEIKLREIESMILRDRNHPCIFFWSISNEEVIGSTPMAVRMAGRIAAHIRNLDSKRLLVSAELLNPEGMINPEYMDIFDVIGVNYPESGLMGDGLNNMKKRYPDKPFMSTENASYFSTRGIYQDNWEKCQTNNFGSNFSMMQEEPLPDGAPGAGGTAHPEDVMDFWDTHRFMGGSFIWTAFDYCGEPSPFPWPAISSQFGIMDTCGFPKDYFYYYKARWNPEPSIHLMPHWNWNVFQNIKVRVFSNCEEAELFLNEVSLGKKSCGKHHTTWEVEFATGELKVVGYENGQVVATDVKHTTGDIAGLGIRRMDAENDLPGVGDSLLLEIYAFDSNGYEIPTADHLISVTINENGKLLGMGNGNPCDHTPNQSLKRNLFSGKLAVIVQKENKEGQIQVCGSAEGLAGVSGCEFWV